MSIEEMRFYISLLDKKGEVKKEFNSLDICEVENILMNLDNDLYDYNIRFKNNTVKGPKIKKIKR